MDDDFAAAKRLHAADRLEEAVAAYRRVGKASPDYPKALNNLGVVFEALQRPREAIAAYQCAAGCAPEHWLPHYNLGHVLHGQRRFAAAADAYRRALDREPSAVKAAFSLGCALADQGERQAAIAAYRRALEIDPECFEALSNLGAELFAAGSVDDARAAYEAAVKLRPDTASEHFNLACALAVLRRYDDAIAAYRRSLALNPLSPVAREHLARALEQAGRRDEAETACREWAALMPGDPTAEHMLKALTEPATPHASAAYVRAVFDRFADDFDATLVRLDYRSPAALAQTLGELLGPSPEPSLDVLDAGCGTGLCAPALRPHARRLVGVNLSPGMLGRARERGLYDELHEQELVAYLQTQRDAFDLIAAMDTFIYFGALEALLDALREALKPDGTALFTLEQGGLGTPLGYRLETSGRFTHSEPYVRARLEQSGLRLASLAATVLRLESGRPVAGWLATVTRERTIRQT